METIQIPADISSEIVEARIKWNNIFLGATRKKNCQTRILYPVKISFRNEEEMEIFSDKEKQRICHQQPYLKRMAKGSSSNRKEMKKES